ncbi:hypothetical protein BN8_03668 [Fibrisoma limi BUZ 3]|uniref:Uncharacterized protein n=1 Tax=Fibrisoma limi BUZ 3 TaxID=1185876 RepID=I2GKR6_9BACT|nr:hypothetical protein [Fibrisoma limi]CCH54492.1 hypothetical protein BN8_03668 [Fibrisoma limi BUZ 3]
MANRVARPTLTATGEGWEYQLERDGIFSDWFAWPYTFTTDPEDGGELRANVTYWLYCRNLDLPGIDVQAASFKFTEDDRIVTVDPAGNDSDADNAAGLGLADVQTLIAEALTAVTLESARQNGPELKGEVTVDSGSIRFQADSGNFGVAWDYILEGGTVKTVTLTVSKDGEILINGDPLPLNNSPGGGINDALGVDPNATLSILFGATGNIYFAGDGNTPRGLFFQRPGGRLLGIGELGDGALGMDDGAGNQLRIKDGLLTWSAKEIAGAMALFDLIQATNPTGWLVYKKNALPDGRDIYDFQSLTNEQAADRIVTDMSETSLRKLASRLGPLIDPDGFSAVAYKVEFIKCAEVPDDPQNDQDFSITSAMVGIWQDHNLQVAESGIRVVAFQNKYYNPEQLMRLSFQGTSQWRIDYPTDEEGNPIADDYEGGFLSIKRKDPL